MTKKQEKSGKIASTAAEELRRLRRRIKTVLNEKTLALQECEVEGMAKGTALTEKVLDLWWSRWGKSLEAATWRRGTCPASTLPTRNWRRSRGWWGRGRRWRTSGCGCGATLTMPAPSRRATTRCWRSWRDWHCGPAPRGSCPWPLPSPPATPTSSLEPTPAASSTAAGSALSWEATASQGQAKSRKASSSYSLWTWSTATNTVTSSVSSRSSWRSRPRRCYPMPWSTTYKRSQSRKQPKQLTFDFRFCVYVCFWVYMCIYGEYADELHNIIVHFALKWPALRRGDSWRTCRKFRRKRMEASMPALMRRTCFCGRLWSRDLRALHGKEGCSSSSWSSLRTTPTSLPTCHSKARCTTRTSTRMVAFAWMVNLH